MTKLCVQPPQALAKEGQTQTGRTKADRAKKRSQARLKARGHRQGGFASLQVILLLVVMMIILIAKMRSDIKTANRFSGNAIGQQMLTINNALLAYITNTNIASKIKNGGTYAGVANIMAPTVAELKAVAGLDGAVSETPLFAGGSFNTQVVLLPAGCTTTCGIATRLWMSDPLTEPSGKLNIDRIGSAVQAIGGNGGFSEPQTPAIINGSSGWTLPNPDSAQRAGIVMAVNWVSSAGTPPA
jgi:hypothetical protein